MTPNHGMQAEACYENFSCKFIFNKYGYMMIPPQGEEE
jgi:hypothetical protein